MTRKFILLLLLLCLGLNVQAGNKKEKSSRPKVALVLGGGGGKGAAAIGVLKYIEQADIPIDMVVGTSVGSILGGLYSVGYRAADLDTLFQSQNWLHLFVDVAKPKYKRFDKRKHIPGVMTGDRLTQMIDSLLGYRTCHFDSLPIPMRCVAVNIRKFEEVWIDHGNVAQAIRASMSVPIAFTAVERDSMVLVDGGLLNNLPVDVARSMGADIVIAIDLMDAKRATQESRGTVHTNGIFSIMEWEYARPDLDKYHLNREDADVLIHPDVEGFNGASFKASDTRQLILNGEKAGQAALGELMELKKRINPLGFRL